MPVQLRSTSIQNHFKIRYAPAYVSTHILPWRGNTTNWDLALSSANLYGSASIKPSGGLLIGDHSYPSMSKLGITFWKVGGKIFRVVIFYLYIFFSKDYTLIHIPFWHIFYTESFLLFLSSKRKEGRTKSDGFLKYPYLGKKLTRL